MPHTSGLNGEGQNIPTSLWEITVNGSLGKTQHSQSSVSQARGNSEECYDIVKKNQRSRY